MAFKQQVSKTRPNDTTQYAVGDVIAETGTSTVWTFPGMASSDGGVVRIETSTLLVSTDEVTALQANLLLFTVAPATVNDNTAAAITDAEMLNCVGSIVFATPTKAVLSALYTTNPNLVIKLAEGTRKLYGVLVAVNTYTPVASAVLTITLNGTLPRG